MSSPLLITAANREQFLQFSQYHQGDVVGPFSCPITEYNYYLEHDALRSRGDHVALTWLLKDIADGGTVAYMSLIADAIKLSVTEKELHHLDYPFKTIPAMKIAKLAVSTLYAEKYKGIGSVMITAAKIIALLCDNEYFSCRFLTVDADIEHDAGVMSFYEKTGFVINTELYNKNRKTVSMRKDIYID